MKNITITGICLILFFTLFSCEKGITDFLDKAPGVDVTEDTIFSSKSQIETYIAGLYMQAVPSGLPLGNKLLDAQYTNDNITDACTDAGEMGDTWFPSQVWNVGGIQANNILNQEDYRFYYRWYGLRRANILIERIDAANVDAAYKEQVKAEAKCLRAFLYLEMFKRYGGVPIVDKRLRLIDNMKVPRNSVKEVVDFIVKDCDEAAAVLPSSWVALSRGRVTKGVALMIKSKTLLYAASPLFNTATPYLDLGANNKLICYGNYDANRWKLAADAAKAVLDWAPGAGCILVNNQGVTKNYKYVWEKHDNSEIILEYKGYPETDKGASTPWARVKPRSIYSGWGGVSVPLNFVKFYEKTDGTPQTWDAGNNLNQKYAELDPRFAQTIAANGSRWNGDYPAIDMTVGGTDAANCFGGAWMHKLIPDELSNAKPKIVPLWINFRLAEAYLSYAEALNEFQGPVQDAYDAVNTIRTRSGMPNLPSGLSKDEFRERVRNEETIEFAFEDHRLWDIRRWLIAENDGVMKGNMWGIKINKLASPSTEFSFTPYVFEIRSFHPRMYLHPFIQKEVYLGYLIQNPGW